MPAQSRVQLSLQTSQDGKDASQVAPVLVSHLTPPVTPTINGCTVPCRSTPSPLLQTERKISPRHVWTPLRFTDDVDIFRDSDGRPIEFGRGAWSIVYKARSHDTAAPTTAPCTPPSSQARASRVLAVKAPLRRDAHAVLQAEALILTHLNVTPGCENHVVPFHGYLPESPSLVLSAVPLALSTYIEDQADLARRKQSTLTMFEPVQGRDAWQDLARKLISGLIWLHSTAGILHGDIKPHNLLLRPIAEADTASEHVFPYEPLFADFSSAVDLPTDSLPSPQDTSRASMSAFTPPFTAPELLCLASLTSGNVAPTPASDVFSLAATLLAAATGDLLLYPGSSSMQRLAMAREGHRIIEFTRSSMNGCRVPRNGLVEKVIQPAVAKDPVRRIPPQEWLVIASA